MVASVVHDDVSDDLQALVLRVRSKSPPDDDAFADFYRRFLRLVHGVVLSRVEAGAVDDVVQEVFVTAAAKLSTLENAAAVGAWLCAIARSKAIDHLRRRGPRGVTHEELQDHHASADAPGDAVIDAGRALQALRALPEAYRETLTLRLVEGMTGPEIARLTGLTEGSVRVNLHRGMQLLRESLRHD